MWSKHTYKRATRKRNHISPRYTFHTHHAARSTQHATHNNTQHTTIRSIHLYVLIACCVLCMRVLRAACSCFLDCNDIMLLAVLWCYVWFAINILFSNHVQMCCRQRRKNIFRWKKEIKKQKWKFQHFYVVFYYLQNHLKLTCVFWKKQIYFSKQKMINKFQKHHFLW